MSRAGLGVIVGFLVVAVAAGAVVVHLTGAHHPHAAAVAPETPEGWRASLLQAFGGPTIVTQISDATAQFTGFLAGTTPPAAFVQAETGHLSQLIANRDAVRALPSLPSAPLAPDLATRSAELEVEWIRLLLDTADVPAGPARDQLATLARQVRELSDRVFDRVGAVLAPLRAPTTTDPDIVVEGPTEVPDWVAEGLAVGPPLDDPPAAAATYPPTRQEVRPTQPRADWVAATTATHAPTPSALAGAIYAEDAAACQTMARTWVAASQALGLAADPAGPGGREEADRIRLGFLIDADAARAAQLATLVPAPAAERLQASAQRLLLVGQGLWSPDLGAHGSSIDPALLVADGR